MTSVGANMAPGGSSDLGNTKPGRPGEKRASREGKMARTNAGKRWVFTWNNPMAPMAPEILGTMGAEYGFGVETAPTTGTVHLQGWVVFKEKCRPIEKTGWTGVHWEPMRGTLQQSIDYCSKEGDYHTNRRVFRPRDAIGEDEAWEWQQSVLDSLDDETRDITVVGGSYCGKTALAKHLVLQRGAYLMTSFVRTEIMATLKGAITAEEAIFVWDVPEGDQNAWPMDVMQNLKGGLCVVGGKPLMWDRVWIIVLVTRERLADMPVRANVQARVLE